MPQFTKALPFLLDQMNTNNAIHRLPHQVIPICLCLASLIGGLRHTRGWAPIEVYYFFLLGSVLAILIYQVFEKRPAIERRDWFTILALFLVAAAFRFYGISDRCLWLDESVQISGALSSSSVILAAAENGQPPLDYFLTALSLDVFGKTAFAARFFAALSGSLTVPLFFLLLRSAECSRVISQGVALLVLLSPGLLYYSREGRPVSLGVLLTVCYGLTVFSLVKSRFKPAAVAGLGAITLLYFLVLGFQPVIFSLTACLCAVYFLFWCDFRRPAFLFLVSQGAALLLFLPILLLLKSQSKGNLHSFSFHQLTQSLQKINVGTWVMQLSLLHGFLPYFMILLLLLPLGLLHGPKVNRERVRLLGVSLLGCLLFPLIFSSVFHLMINWPLAERYYLVYSVPIFLTLGLLSEFFKDVFLSAISNLRQGVWLRRIFLGVFACGLSLTLWDYGSLSVAALKRSENSDLRPLYQYFQVYPKAGGVAFLMSFQSLDRWLCYKFLLTEFYYPKARSQRVRLLAMEDPEDPYDFLKESLRVKPEPPELFFVFMPDFNEWTPDPDTLENLIKDFPGARLSHFGDIRVAEIPNEKGFLVTAKQFYTVIQGLRNDELNHQATEALIEIALYQRDHVAIQKGLDHLKEIVAPKNQAFILNYLNERMKLAP